MTGNRDSRMDSFTPEDHPRGENGQFVCKGYQRIANSKEISNFLKDSVASKDFKKISVSKVAGETRQKIKELTGYEVKRIVLDSCSVKHALKKEEHHITPGDLKKIPRIVNKTKAVSLEEKNHLDNKALMFSEEKTNGLKIVMEVRAKKGDLALVTMYRPKKAR